MNRARRAVLLIGSPKPKASTSASLGDYLCGRLRERGLETDTIHINTALKADDTTDSLLSAVDDADVVVLSFPLYVDNLPAGTIRCLEMIADHRRRTAPEKQPGMAAVVNSGFPEASQNDTALEICRNFARQAGFEWLGGLAMGGGAAISGRPLEEAGGMARHARKALEAAAEDIARNTPISEDAAAEMAKPMVAGWLYRWIAERQWRKQAKETGIAGRLDDRPYER